MRLLVLKPIEIPSEKPLWAYCEPNESEEWAKGEILKLTKKKPSKAHFAVGWDESQMTIGVFRRKDRAERFAGELATVYPKTKAI